MLGPRLTSVFKSRWSALLWAGMVIWSAVSFVGSGTRQDAAPAPEQRLSHEDEAAIRRALDGQ